MANALLDLLQGASNASASVVSAPLDALAWGLRKAGLPIREPLGGSAWMERVGLTRRPQNALAGLLGEAAGMAVPTVAAAKAPQVARGLLAMGERAAAPRALNPQRGVLDMGMDMSEAARAQRMAEQGYDAGWYHGHSGPAFDAFDPTRAGSVTGTPAGRVASFATRSAEDAAEFARNADAVTGAGANVMQLAARPRKPATVQWKDTWPPIRSEGGQRFLAGLLADAREQGFDAVVLRGGNDSISGKSAADVLAVLDTAILRDVKRARFDPAKAGQNGLTLGVAGLAAGPAVMGRDR